MSLHLYAENNDGDIVEVPGKLRADTLEVQQQAAEGATGESTIILDDPDGEFYIRGHKPLYLVEDEAADDDWFGLIGVFFSWERTFRRGNHRTEAGREVHIAVKDVNTLLTRRVQKGTDAERPQETDVARVVDWLTNTPEFVGQYSVEDRDFLFEDSPQEMSETSYVSQDSMGVVNDALQDSGKNAYLFPSPTEDDPLRFGMWFGRTERADYASPHRISNYLSDISPETLDPDWMFDPVFDYDTEFTFAPSLDSELSRQPDRVASGVMVMADGSYGYVTRPETAEAFAQRDMVMQAELVKTQAQAVRRATRYTRDLRNEDDAITTAVLVPAALVNAFVQGQRVQFRSSFLPGYAADFVWLRVAQRTVRQVSAGSKLYELALDLRAEEPPDSDDTGPGIEPCSDLTASGDYYPLGSDDPGTWPASGEPFPSDGVSYYLTPGIQWPIEPTPGHNGHWHFGSFGVGGAGTTDYPGSCTYSFLRVMVRGNGTLVIHTSVEAEAQTLTAVLRHHQYSDPDAMTGGIDVIDETQTGIAVGSDISFDISTHEGENCTHWVDVRDEGTGCGAGWGFGYDGSTWTLDT